MFRNIFSIIMAVLFLLCLTFNVYSNGRSPGIHVSDVPVQAICEDITGTKHTFTRVKIANEDSSVKFLSARIGAADSQIEIGRIDKLIFQGGKIDQDGYSKAEIILKNGNKENYMVMVQNKGKDFILIGSNPQGIKLNIPLYKCKIIKFLHIVHEYNKSIDHPIPKK